MRLSVKITVAIFMITVLVFSASGYVMFQYFSSILLNQLYRDDQIRLDSIVAELDGILEESEKYASHLAVNREIQGYLSQGDFSAVTERFRVLSQIREACNENMFLSQYIHSAVIVKGDTDIVGTFIPFSDALSTQMLFQWYDVCMDASWTVPDEQMTISEPYEFSSGRRMIKMISISMPCRSLQSANQRLGTIVVNIEWSTIQEILDRNNKAFDAVALLRDGELFLPDESRLDRDTIAQIAAQPKNNLSYYSANTTLGFQVVAIQDYFGSTRAVQPQALIMLLIFLVTVVLVICILVPVLLLLTKPAKTLANAMKQAGAGRLDTRVSIATHDEFADLGDGFNRMVEQIDRHIDESLQFQKDKHRLEYEVLIAQINPHFIYNTLNTIIHLARKERCSDIMTLTSSFIDLLQDGIHISENNVFSTVEKELRIIRNYMCIQNYRYKDLFLLEIDCPDEFLQEWIPCSVLQPVVENALFHGIAPLDRQGHIWITITRQPGEDSILVRVADEGVGITQEQVDRIMAGEQPDYHRNHIGLQNVRSRMKLLDSGNRFEIGPRPEGGTVVSMSFASYDPKK